MKHAKWMLLVVAALLVASPMLAQGFVLRGGDDALTTPGGGQTNLDLAGYPIREVFGAPVDGSTLVSLKGQPFNRDLLGDADAIVTRPKDISVGTAGGSGPLRISALSLVSEAPVSIGGTSYDLHVTLSDFAGQVASGKLSVGLSNGDGGTFDSEFFVRPKLTFTKAGTTEVAQVIDCGVVTCGTGDLAMKASGGSWVRSGGPGRFDPAAFNIAAVPSGLSIDSDGDGRTDYKTVGSSNFYVGVTASAPGFKLISTSKVAMQDVHVIIIATKPPIATK
jgi:hypothetical protein